MYWLELCALLLCMLGSNVHAYSVKKVAQSSNITPQEFQNGELLAAINDHVQSNGQGQQLQDFVCGTKQVVEGMLYVVHYYGACQGADCQPPQCIATIWKRSWESPDDQTEVKVKCGVSDSAFASCQEASSSDNKIRFTSSESQAARPVMSMDKLDQDSPFLFDLEVKNWFDQFIVTYNRNYSLSEDAKTYQHRYYVFHKNLKHVQKLNADDKGTAVYGVTKFMDYTADEYRRFLAPGFSSPFGETRMLDMENVNLSDLPESVDWRTKGAVTPVKNQGQCGSCWAFSTTGNVEGQWYLKHGKLYSLSEQELVDCDSLDEGCNGGLPANAYKSIEKLGGLETEKDYPYDATDDPCTINKSEFKVYINDSVYVSKDEVQIANALYKIGPLSIGINAHNMQFYQGGISHPTKTFCSPQSLDHGVLIVGYGTENGTPFWIIKNSWGPDWGEEGYYRIYRGDGSCGVNLMVTSSIIY